MSWLDVASQIFGLKADDATPDSIHTDDSHRVLASALMPQMLDAGNSATLATANFPTHTASVTTTLNSNTITSAALFSASDVGASITGTGIPSQAVIIAVASTSSATFQTPGTQLFPNGTAATASGTITATIRRGFSGTFLATRAAGYVRQLVILGSNAVNVLGGLFAFYGSEDGTNNTVVVVKPFGDLRSVDNQDLINAWGYFKISFVADRALTADELIFLSTTQRKQDDGQFAVQLTDSQEKQNLLLRQNMSFLSGFRPSGKSIDIGATGDRALRTFVGNAYQTPSGSLFVEGIRDDMTHDFGIDTVVAETGKLTNNSTGSGTVTPDTTNGGAIFSTGATAGSVCCYLSNDQIVYSDDTGHGLMGEQTVFLNQLPTGNAFVEFGLFRADLKDWFGYGVDATGIYVAMRKNVNPGVFGSYTFKTYQTAWNRDPCTGAVDSLFARTVNGLSIPETLTMLADNLFRIGTELLYARGQRFEVSPPSDTPMTILAHINEYGNQATATSLRAGNLFLGVYLSNGTSGQTLTLTSGSWRGGVFTSQDSDFTEVLNNKLRDTDELRIDAEPTTAFTRTVTDGVLNSTTTVTSATAAFKASDVGFVIAGTGIPANTTILSVTNSTTAVMSAAALVTTSGVTLTISCGVIFKGVGTDGTAQSQASWKVAAIYNSVTRNPFRMRFRKNIAWASRLSGWS